MKKLLLIVECIVFLDWCTDDINPDVILSTEAKDKGLNLESSSAHLISYKDILVHLNIVIK